MILAGVNVAAVILVSSDSAYVSHLKLPLLIGFGFYFIVALTIASLFGQLANRLNPDRPTDGELDGLKLKDLKRVLQWSPRPYKIVGLLGLFSFCATFLVIGGVAWETKSPFERHHAIGIGLYVAALYAIALPVLAAFARLPSSVGEQIKVITGSDT